MEDKVRDLHTEPDIESVQIVQNSARETSQVFSGPDSTIVDLLKTMQEQIIVSNKLLSGLVDNDQRLNSRKRNKSLSESDDENMVYTRSVTKEKGCAKSVKLSLLLHIGNKHPLWIILFPW